MRTILYGLVLSAGAGIPALSHAAGPHPAPPAAKAQAIPAKAALPGSSELSATIERTVALQLANPSGAALRGWTIAPLYAGLIRAALATGRADFPAPVLRMGRQSGWTLNARGRFAGDHAVGQAWLDLYLMDPRHGERLEPVRARMTGIVDVPLSGEPLYRPSPRKPGDGSHDGWSLLEALSMGPPLFARLYRATGDARYIAFMDREFRAAVDALYDHEAHLLYSDIAPIAGRPADGRKTFPSRANGMVYAALPQILEQLPQGHASRAYYEALFRDLTIGILKRQGADGLWRTSLLQGAQAAPGETTGSAFFAYGLAWGMRHGLLDRTRVLPALGRAWSGLQARGAAAGAARLDEAGAYLLAASEMLRLTGDAPPAQAAALLAGAEALLAQDDRRPRAYARVVPERMDDLAWENDKVAFRMYGPALRQGPEDSGIDAWFKKVRYPVLDKWYRLALGPEQKSYHADHGEGYDAYHVGNTRGVGGLGLWVDGRLLTSDTFIEGEVHWTGPDVAAFSNVFAYPVTVDGKPVYEHRHSRLRMGERMTEIRSFFSHSENAEDAPPILDFPYEVAIGLVTQDAARAQIALDRGKGLIAVSETVDGQLLGTGVALDPARIHRTAGLAAADKDGKHAHALAFTRVDARGYVHYRSGFAWSGDGDITRPDQWLAYLAKQAAAMRGQAQ